MSGPLSGRRPSVVALSVLVLLAAILTGWLLVDDSTTSGPSGPVAAEKVLPTIKGGVYLVGTIPDSDARAALQTAVEATPAALSYDYRSLDRSLTAAEAFMTTAFAAEFRETFQSVVRKQATAEQVIVTTLVRGAGIATTVEDDRVTCLVYLDQFLLASQGEQPAKPASAVQALVTLEKVEGTWKVSDIERF